MLWRMENGELDFKIPLKAAVIFVGTNNVDCSPEDVFEGILKLLQTVRTKLGDLPLVLPVSTYLPIVSIPHFKSVFYRPYCRKDNIRILTGRKTRR